MSSKTRQIYLDNGATTRIDPLVSEEMSAFEGGEQARGVPTQIHSCGRSARKALNASRERIARCLGTGGDVDEREIVFTSGATEANNLALMGATQALRHRGNHIITSSVEHPSVLLTCKALERQGFVVTYIPVGNTCKIDPADVIGAIRDETILISIILADSEIGAIQPIQDVADAAKSRDIAFHTDAAQAVGKIPVRLGVNLGVDLLSLSAHKFHGPKGVGALYIRSGTRVTPLMHGSPDEAALRPGTLNVANCVGMAKALELATDNLEEDMSRVASLRDRLRRGLVSDPCAATLNGPADDRDRLPGTLSLRFDGNSLGGNVNIEAESLLLNLDMAGVYVGAGSPCASGALGPSHVLRAMGLSPVEAGSSITFSIARDTTLEEIDIAVEKLGEVTSQLRSVPV